MKKQWFHPSVQKLMDVKSEHDPTMFLGSPEMYIIFGIILLLAVLLFIWAAYLRKPKRKRVSRSSSPELPSQILRAPRERQRKRRRRWKNRNPTLSQTGGLPSPKDEGAFPDPS